MVIENSKFGAIMCLVAIVSFSLWPLWQWLNLKTAPPAVRTRAEALVAKNPQLKPALNIALHDGTLTEAEAKEIIEAAGEKYESDK